MNIWNCDNWEKVYKGNNIRNGLRLRFDVNVDEEVKLALKDFAKHLRKADVITSLGVILLCALFYAYFW